MNRPTFTLISHTSRAALALFCFFCMVAVSADPILNSATLPNARVVPDSTTATIFMTTSNTGDTDATNCSVVASQEIGGPDISSIDVSWALSSGGVLAGGQNELFSIPSGGFAQLVLGISKNASAGPFDSFFNPLFRVQCDAGAESPAWPAVNGARISFSDTQQDIIPIVTTPSNDLIANFDVDNRLAVIGAAAINNTAILNNTGEVEVGVGANYLGFRNAGHFDYLACETDPVGACVTDITTCSPGPFAPCFTTMLGQTPKTFAFFPILPEGQGALFSPNSYRFAVTFFSEFNSPIASSSVALNSPQEATPPGSAIGQYELLQRNTGDFAATSLRTGRLNITEDFILGTFFRAVDLGAIILGFSQEFLAETGASTEEGTFFQLQRLMDLINHFQAETSDAIVDANLVLNVRPNIGGTFTYEPPMVPPPVDPVEDLLPQEPIEGVMAYMDVTGELDAFLNMNGFTVFDLAGNSTAVELDPGADSIEIMRDGCVISVDLVPQFGGAISMRITSCDSPDNPLSMFVGQDAFGVVNFNNSRDGQVRGTFAAVFKDENPELSRTLLIDFFIDDESFTTNTEFTANAELPLSGHSSDRFQWAKAIGEETGKPVYWVNQRGDRELIFSPNPDL